jgi:hypothetical protein
LNVLEALDFGAVAFRRRVVEHQQHAVAQRDRAGDLGRKQRGERLDLAAQRTEEIIIVFVVVGDAGRSQPTADGPPALAEEDASKDRQQPKGISFVEQIRERANPLGHLRRQLPSLP